MKALSDADLTSGILFLFVKVLGLSLFDSVFVVVDDSFLTELPCTSGNPDLEVPLWSLSDNHV